MSKTQPARGMRDFLPADIRKRNYVINIIKEVYESYGFEPLETPAVENLETLTGKYGEEGNQLIFKILKRGEKLDVNDKELADLALRYDLTVPLARVVANNRNELPKFFKRYQIQPVWRADRPARGRFREFYQCDVDAIGSKSMVVEAELISAVCEILGRLGFEEFTIRLNHREALTGVLNHARVPREKHTDALVALDKIDKIGREGVIKELNDRDISNEATLRLMSFYEFFIKEVSKDIFSDDNKKRILTIQREIEHIEEINKTLRNVQNSSISSKEEIIKSLKAVRAVENFTDELEKNAEEIIKTIPEELSVELQGKPNPYWDEILKALRNNDTNISLKYNVLIISELIRLTLNEETTNIGVKELLNLIKLTLNSEWSEHLKIDPFLARGLSYYTGAIFEISVPDLAGSLGGGGRYDGLIGMFGKEEIPACGFSLGLERIIVVMDERGMFPPEIAESKAADVMVTIWNEEGVAESLKLANELRAEGLRVTLYPEADKPAKQFKYADSIGVEYVCVLGESELADGKVTLKNMKTGEQKTVDRAEVVGKISPPRR